MTRDRSRPVQEDAKGGRYAAYFHELDAWTEYWDIYHPESCGRYYFGNGGEESGLLARLVPRDGRLDIFKAWTRYAIDQSSFPGFAEAARKKEVAEAVVEVDRLLDRIFKQHFGSATDPETHADYLEAIFRFATNALPPALERDAKIPDDDPRKSTAGRHRLEGDLMWFTWALVLEAASLLCQEVGLHPRRNLMLAGVATGCPADFAWRGHRRTRPEYRPDQATTWLLRERGMVWALSLAECAREIRALYRIREWGSAE